MTCVTSRSSKDLKISYNSYFWLDLFLPSHLCVTSMQVSGDRICFIEARTSSTLLITNLSGLQSDHHGVCHTCCVSASAFTVNYHGNNAKRGSHCDYLYAQFRASASCDLHWLATLQTSRVCIYPNFPKSCLGFHVACTLLCLLMTISHMKCPHWTRKHLFHAQWFCESFHLLIGFV